MEYDSTARGHLDTAEVIKPRWFGWLDILGDPIRATTGPADVLFPGNTPDVDLAGKLFVAYNPDLVDVSEVKHSVGGAQTVVATISGLVIPDNQIMNILANPINWQGRSARFWQTIHDQTGVQKGAVVPYHGGIMSSIEIDGDPGQEGSPGTQTISCIIESYSALLSRASGRTYMDQQKYDAADLSAAAALAAANGTRGANLTGGTTVGSGGTGSAPSSGATQSTGGGGGDGGYSYNMADKR